VARFLVLDEQTWATERRNRSKANQARTSAQILSGSSAGGARSNDRARYRPRHRLRHERTPSYAVADRPNGAPWNGVKKEQRNTHQLRARTNGGIRRRTKEGIRHKTEAFILLTSKFAKHHKLEPSCRGRRNKRAGATAKKRVSGE
jgi:hypothetical protein